MSDQRKARPGWRNALVLALALGVSALIVAILVQNFLFGV
jgi:hypothetical protein